MSNSIYLIFDFLSKSVCKVDEKFSLISINIILFCIFLIKSLKFEIYLEKLASNEISIEANLSLFVLFSIFPLIYIFNKYSFNENKILYPDSLIKKYSIFY